jgi:protein required for attachment to host cells
MVIRRPFSWHYLTQVNDPDPQWVHGRAALHQNTGKALVMPINRNLLFVIADGEHVRFVRPAGDNTLHSDAVLESFSAHKRSAALGSDRPGASYHTGSSAHHVLAPRHDMHALEKARFGRTIAQRLNTAAADDGFDELVIVAPPHTLVAVRQRLDAATDAKIVGTLAKDLVKVPDHELWPHLRWWIRPPRREIF